MILLITGSRNWDDWKRLTSVLDMLYSQHGEDVILVSGACPTGADSMCELYADTMGWTIERHPAKWDTYGKRAGYIRNAEMVALGADLCLAFNLNNSPGTNHMVALARKAGIETVVHSQTRYLDFPPTTNDCER